MDSDMIILDITEKMDKTIENLEKRFATVRAGRANPSSLDGVMVEYYGTMTPLKQLATISVPEARQLLIKPFDKGSLGAIEKAILASNLGYNPGNDGETIRIVIPELTEERRNELSKDIKKMSEEAKIAVRAIRGDEMKDAKNQLKDKAISEDEEKLLEDNIQKATDKFIDMIDQITDKKVKEIMTV